MMKATLSPLPRYGDLFLPPLAVNWRLASPGLRALLPLFATANTDWRDAARISKMGLWRRKTGSNEHLPGDLGVGDLLHLGPI